MNDKNEQTIKYALYCRKSTEDDTRQVLSLDSQEQEMIKMAENLGLDIIQTFRESKSAKKPDNRPQFSELINLIKRGKIDGVICWKIDRLSRNPIDSAIIQWLLQQNNLKIIQTMERQYLPGDNALLFNVESGMANQFILDLSKNVKRGIRAKLTQGYWPNLAPIGYLNKDLKIVVDKHRAKFIRRVFEMYNTGQYGVKEISQILYEDGFRSRGGKKYYPSTIHMILSNSFYCGIMEKDGIKYLGKYEPIITKALFDDVQVILGVKKHIKSQIIPFAFRGLLKCAKCGCLLTATLKKGKHIYYYCTNGKNTCQEHKVYLTEDYLDKELLGVFDKLIFDDEAIEMCYQTKKEQGNNNLNYLEELELTLKIRLAKLKERRNTLLDAYLDKTLDKAVYEAKDKQLNNEEINSLKDLSDLKEKLKEAGTDTLERIKNVFLEPKRMKKGFLTLSLEKKREVLFSLLWNAEIGNKKIANISFKEPYKQLSEITNKSDFSSMLPGSDSNRRPIGYTCPHVSIRGGLYHHPYKKDARRFGPSPRRAYSLSG
ncbi:MAG: recombinase family protein [Patescibacteria group bacterium]